MPSYLFGSASNTFPSTELHTIGAVVSRAAAIATHETIGASGAATTLTPRKALVAEFVFVTNFTGANSGGG